MTAMTQMVRTFIVGLGGIAILLAVVLFGITASSGMPFTPKTIVRAAFDNVGAPLKVGDDVRENSSRIGRVSTLEYRAGKAIVTMELNGDLDVHADARAAIWDQSALAKKFVLLHRGNAEAGPLGDETIPMEHTTGSADLDDVLDVLDKPTRDALGSTLREVGTGAAGHGQDVHDFVRNAPDLVHDVGQVSGALASSDADLAGLLREANELAGSLQGRHRQLAALVEEVGTTSKAIVVDGGAPLQNALSELPSTLDAANASFTSLDKPLRDLHVGLDRLRPGAKALAEATPDLRGVLTEGPTPLNKVPAVARKAEPTVDKLTSTVADARPLAPAVSRGLTDLSPPLTTLATYSREVVEFFRRIESMVSTSVAPGVHGARVGVAAAGPALVTGGVLNDPLQGQNFYPAPGEADRDHTSSPINILPGGNF